MKKFIVSLLLLTLCFTAFFCSIGQSGSAAAARRIILIRHGEKPDQGDNLSCAGFNRALQLPAVLNKKFGALAEIYVPAINTGKQTSTARMYQTAVPLAVKYNLGINSKYDVDDVAGLAQSLLKKEGTTLVVWEHKKINNIVKALGVEQKIDWADDDYDSIWIITFQDGKAVLTTDKEGIKAAANCP